MTAAGLLLLATVWTYWNHEPADHLRRMSYRVPSVFTLGEGMTNWYERLHGEKLISEAAALGVDTVYVHFFKGFGLEHERAEMERTRDFVRLAHAKGVKVLGYCQLCSLYHETLRDEFPDLEKWTARTYTGEIQTYAGMYFRWTPCFESREFMSYLKRTIRYGIEEVGLDGFHFDNSYARDCYCERCQKAFREWLAANIRDPRTACGLAHFRNVRIPQKIELEAAGQEWHDPLQIWRARFRIERLAAAHREIFDYAKSFGADKLVLHNPAYGRPRYETCGVDVAIEPKSCDFLLGENRRFIRSEGGRLVTQIPMYKLGRRFGFKVFDSSWPSRKEIDWVEPRTDIPRTADAISRFYAQGMIYGDIVGCPWLARSVKCGDRVVLDEALQKELAAAAFGFFRENESDLYATTPVAKTHLLYVTYTFNGWTYAGSGFMSFFDAAESLNASGVPYTIVTEDEVGGLAADELLVLPDVRFMTVALHDTLRAAGTRGVRILPTGKAGLYDESGRERDVDNPICGLRDVPNVVSEVPREFKVETSVPGILAETQLNAKGELVLHLLRVDNATVLPELTVAFADPRASGQATSRSFEGACRLADTRFAEGRRTLVFRDFRTMASVVFRR